MRQHREPLRRLIVGELETDRFINRCGETQSDRALHIGGRVSAQMELSMGPSGVERRRFPRRKCGLPAEVKTAENRYPWRGETTDVSVGGCYVMLPFVLPVGTEATISLWIDGNKLDAQCTVKTADPGVGIGVQFENITEEQRKLLSDRLDREETAPDSELLIVR